MMDTEEPYTLRLVHNRAQRRVKHLRATVVALALVLLAAGFIVAHLRVEVRDARATVHDLQRTNAALLDRQKKWEKIAHDFEALNRQCLELTFGGGR